MNKLFVIRNIEILEYRNIEIKLFKIQLRTYTQVRCKSISVNTTLSFFRSQSINQSINQSISQSFHLYYAKCSTNKIILSTYIWLIIPQYYCSTRIIVVTLILDHLVFRTTITASVPVCPARYASYYFKTIKNFFEQIKYMIWHDSNIKIQAS